MGWIAPAVSVVGTVMGLNESRKQSKQQAAAAADQRRAQRLEQRIADVRAARERRQGLAAEQKARAQQTAAAFAAGAADSSALQGALGASRSQVASNVGFNSMIGDLSGQVSIFNISAANHQSKAATHGAMAGLYKEVGSIFSGATFG